MTPPTDDGSRAEESGGVESRTPHPPREPDGSADSPPDSSGSTETDAPASDPANPTQTGTHASGGTMAGGQPDTAGDPPGPDDPLRPPPISIEPSPAAGLPGPVYAVYVLLFVSAAFALLWSWDRWEGFSPLLDGLGQAGEGGGGSPFLDLSVIRLYLARIWLLAYGVACIALGLLVARGRRVVLWAIVGVMVLDVVVKALHLLLGSGALAFTNAATEFIYPAVILTLVLTPVSRAFFVKERRT